MILVGGVGELFQGDLDVGRVVAERLAGEPLGDHALVEDLHYGAVAVAQRLEEVKATHLVLVGAVVRGRPPGTVERRLLAAELSGPAEVQQAVGDAVVGYVSIDLVVEVAAGLGVLPARAVAIEVEPVAVGPSDQLSSEVAGVVEEMAALARAEIRRAPLLELSASIGERLAVDGGRLGDAPAAVTMAELIGAIEVLGDEGRWGRLFVLRDRLRRQIDAGQTGEGMDTLDWALWWALLEELDRLIEADAGAPPAT